MALKNTPAIQLTEYQRRWMADRSQFKIAVKSRQIGLTFATTLEIAQSSVERRQRWRIISRTQDTAKEAMREVRNHLAAMRVALAGDEVQPTDMFFDGARIASFVITLPNASEIQALTAHPDAGRGFPGNFFLDEFAFHRDSYELWKGAFPNTLRGHRMIVCSAPHYQTGKYYELARYCDLVSGRPPGNAGLPAGAAGQPGGWRSQGIWSAHWIDIYTAAPQLKEIVPTLDLDALRDAAGDDETWNQEFRCQFLSAAEMWIGLDLIAAARSPLASLEWDPGNADLPIGDANREIGVPGPANLFVGADIGRKRDRTEIWIDERAADVAICRGLITLDRAPFERQFEVLASLVAHPRVRRASIDQTGIGMALVERLQEKFGPKVEGVTFTAERKESMAILVRRRMEQRLDKIPENAPNIERDLAAIKRESTASGNLRFDAARTDAGHADIFWAKALADLAADSNVEAACYGNDDVAEQNSRGTQPSSIWTGGEREDRRPRPSLWSREYVGRGMLRGSRSADSESEPERMEIA